MTQKENSQTEALDILKFDPIILLRDVAKHWVLIILVALLAGMGAYAYDTVTYEPVYTTSMTYVTYTRSSSATVYSNLSSATTVAPVFEELLNSSLLRNAIMRESGMGGFHGVVQARVIPETNLLTVSVSGPEPRSVFLMAQAIVDHHGLVTYQVIDNVSLELLRSPTVPMAPGNPRNTMSLVKKAVVLAAAGMILVLGYLSYMRDVVRSGKEAETKLDCSYMGEVAHERRYKTFWAFLRRRGSSILVTNPLSSFRFVETFRKLASRVEYHMHGQKVVMVTSLMEDEGKSTVAVNLALSMALKREKVLLIDCDLRKPACHEMLEPGALQHGLCDVLEGRTELPGALVRDKKSGLYMLLETRATQDSGDYLNSPHMRRLLDRARQSFDLVVLDLPPMALVSDTESVMELADASVLVVRQNKAPAAGINRAIAALRGGRAKLLGCVLNDVHGSVLTSGGYGYGYGYGYGKRYRYGSYGHYGHYGKYGHYGHYGHYGSSGDEGKQE